MRRLKKARHAGVLLALVLVAALLTGWIAGYTSEGWVWAAFWMLTGFGLFTWGAVIAAFSRLTFSAAILLPPEKSNAVARGLSGEAFGQVIE